MLSAAGSVPAGGAEEASLGIEAGLWSHVGLPLRVVNCSLYKMAPITPIALRAKMGAMLNEWPNRRILASGHSHAIVVPIAIVAISDETMSSPSAL